MLKNGCITIDEYKATIENGEVTTVEKGICEQVSNKRKFTVVSQEETGKLLPGDELAIDTEHFYVVSSDENETVMLAKYNLNVGNNTQPEEYGKLGMQNSKAIGTNNDQSTQDENYKYPASLAFSSAYYWVDNVGDDSIYSGNYNAPNYPYVYDDNSVLYNYVELYKVELEKNGVKVKEARLLSYQEAIGIGCGIVTQNNNLSCPKELQENSFITSTTFWLGSAYSDYEIWGIYYEGSFNGNNPIYVDMNRGIRPVIVVNTSDIEI